MDDKIRNYLTKAYFYANQAFHRFFENTSTDTPADKNAALAMAAACMAHFSAAASVYISENTVWDESILDLFRQFETVTKAIRLIYHQQESDATRLFLEMDRLEALMCKHGFDV